MDSVIRNGLLITARNRVRASIGIEGGVIAGLYEPGREPPKDRGACSRYLRRERATRR